MGFLLTLAINWYKIIKSQFQPELFPEKDIYSIRPVLTWNSEKSYSGNVKEDIEYCKSFRSL